jgi:hypothetical protein
MLHGKEAESEAIVGGKPGTRVSLQECPQGARGRCPRLSEIIHLERLLGLLLYMRPSILYNIPCFIKIGGGTR